MAKKSALAVAKELAGISEAWVIYQCLVCGNELIDKPNINIPCWHKTAKGKKFPVEMTPTGYDTKNAPAKLFDIIKSKSYFGLLFTESNKKIVGEDDLRKILILLLLGGRLVVNAKPTSFNVLASSSSGSGKDYLVKSILEILPQHYWNHKTRLSPVALNYWHPSKEEPYFSWDSKILYVEDATNHFLNCDAAKVMMSGGNEIGVVKDQRFITIKVNGSPIFVITSATAEPNEELSRRVSIFQTDESQEQTAAILKSQAKQEKKEYNPDLINTAYLLQRKEVFVPFAEELAEHFSKSLYSRTNFSRLIDFIRASAALHQYSRVINDEGEIIADKLDLECGLFVFSKLYQLPDATLTKSQKGLYNYLCEVKKIRTASELFSESGHFHYGDMAAMIKSLRSLAMKGLVSISEVTRDGRICEGYSAESIKLLSLLSSKKGAMTSEKQHKIAYLTQKDTKNNENENTRDSRNTKNNIDTKNSNNIINNNIKIIDNRKELSKINLELCSLCDNFGTMTQDGKVWYCKTHGYEFLGGSQKQA